jgi:hypothetical protein
VKPLRPLLFVRATEGPVKPKRSRTFSISTIVILLLAAIAAVAYYVGTPPPLPSADTSASACPSNAPLVDIPEGVSVKYQVPTLTVVLGVNNTVGWRDQDTSALHVVSSQSVPPGSIQWDFNMTAGNSYCVKLPVAGTYSYEIGFSPTTFPGVIVVKSS